MLRTKRQRDQTACALIATVPILLIIIIFIVEFVRRTDPNNKENPNYISAEQRSWSSVTSCQASRSSYFAGVQTPAMTTTNMFLPLLPTADYITVLGFGGNTNETTTLGVAAHGPCTTNITVLPDPYLTYIVGPNTAAFNLTTSSLSYNYRETASTLIIDTMSVHCQRSVHPRYSYTRSVRVASYGEPSASYTFEVISNKGRTWTNTFSIMTDVYEERTESYMLCTSSWRPGGDYNLIQSSVVTISNKICLDHYRCNDGRADVTIVGDILDLTSMATTTVSSSTRTPASSMVTKTMSQAKEAETGIMPITTSPSPLYTSATAAR